MPGLIDQYGNPISSAELKRTDVAGPSLIGVRSYLSGHPADGLTAQRLAGIHRAADAGDTLAFQELAEDIEERDAHYSAVLSQRRREVVQLPMTIEAADESAGAEAHRAFVEDWAKGLALEDALFDMLDAIAKGYSVHEIEWDVSAGGAVPKRFCYRPQRFFEVGREDGETLMLRDMAGLVPLAEHKFVVHRHPGKSGMLMRSGLARVASWAWMWKAFTVRDWGLFAQNYGAPVRVGRYGPDASEADRDVLWRAVAGIAGDCAAIIPKSMEIEFIQPANLGGGAELYERRASWLDAQVSKLVLGQTATTDANPGSHAAGKTHRLVQEDIERFDARLLGNTISRQVIALMVALNFGPQKAYPLARIGRPDEASIQDITAAIQWLGPQGLTVRAKEVRDRLNLSHPEPGEEVVGGRTPAPAPTPDQPGAADGAPTMDPARADPATAAAPSDPPPTDPPPEPGQKPALHSAMRRLLARHTRAVDPELVEQLTDRLAEDAQGALHGLSLQVRRQFDAAEDMHDLAHRLSKLSLKPDEFATAMQRMLAIGELTGQAALLDEIGKR